MNELRIHAWDLRPGQLVFDYAPSDFRIYFIISVDLDGAWVEVRFLILGSSTLQHYSFPLEEAFTLGRVLDD